MTNFPNDIFYTERTGHLEEVGAVPFAYAFLSGKKTELYKDVLEVVKDAVQLFHTAPCAPIKIISDFELAILNGCTEVFSGVPLSGLERSVLTN